MDINLAKLGDAGVRCPRVTNRRYDFPRIRGRVLHVAWRRVVGRPVVKCPLLSPTPNHAITHTPPSNPWKRNRPAEARNRRPAEALDTHPAPSRARAIPRAWRKAAVPSPWRAGPTSLARRGTGGADFEAAYLTGARPEKGSSVAPFRAIRTRRLWRRSTCGRRHDGTRATWGIRRPDRATGRLFPGADVFHAGLRLLGRGDARRQPAA